LLRPVVFGAASPRFLFLLFRRFLPQNPDQAVYSKAAAVRRMPPGILDSLLVHALGPLGIVAQFLNAMTRAAASLSEIWDLHTHCNWEIARAPGFA